MMAFTVAITCSCREFQHRSDSGCWWCNNTPTIPIVEVTVEREMQAVAREVVVVGVKSCPAVGKMKSGSPIKRSNYR